MVIDGDDGCDYGDGGVLCMMCCCCLERVVMVALIWLIMML
jgi:hypothetical protein